VLVVKAGEMHTAGFAFYRSANGVWLTGHVPSEYLTIPASPESSMTSRH
jgi:putative RNA 2'-phosphotransferase